MRAVRLGIMLTVSTAVFAIPAYAVVNFQTGNEKDERAIHLISGGVGDGVAFDHTVSGSESNIPTPGSEKQDSSVPNPASQGTGGDSRVQTPGSGGDSHVSHPGSGDSSSIPCLFTCSGSGSDSSPSFPASSTVGGGSVSPVPEMSTWSMLVLGFFSIGAIRLHGVRRARKAAETAKTENQA